MAKHSTPRRRSGKHWVGTLLTAGAVVACMGLLLRFLPVGTIPTGGDEPSDSAVSSTEPAASSVPEPEPEPEAPSDSGSDWWGSLWGGDSSSSSGSSSSTETGESASSSEGSGLADWWASLLG